MPAAITATARREAPQLQRAAAHPGQRQGGQDGQGQVAAQDVRVEEDPVHAEEAAVDVGLRERLVPPDLAGRVLVEGDPRGDHAAGDRGDRQGGERARPRPPRHRQDVEERERQVEEHAFVVASCCRCSRASRPGGRPRRPRAARRPPPGPRAPARRCARAAGPRSRPPGRAAPRRRAAPAGCPPALPSETGMRIGRAMPSSTNQIVGRARIARTSSTATTSATSTATAAAPIRAGEPSRSTTRCASSPGTRLAARIPHGRSSRPARPPAGPPSAGRAAGASRPTTPTAARHGGHLAHGLDHGRAPSGISATPGRRRRPRRPATARPG